MDGPLVLLTMILKGNLRSPEQDFKEGGLVGDQAELDLNKNNKIDKGDFEMMNKKIQRHGYGRQS